MPIILNTPFKLSPTDWSLATDALIVASDGVTGDKFGLAHNAEAGSSGSVFQTRNGQWLFVSAPENDVTYTDQGRVYVYEKIGGVWTEDQIIDDPSPTAAGVRFGQNLAASNDGTHLLIGSANNEWHYFELVTGTWTHRQTVTTPDAAPNNFGGTLDISDDGTVAIIGDYGFSQTTAEGYPSNLSGTGKAYVYNRSGTTWSHSADLDPGSRLFNGRMGGSISLAPDGTHAVIGQPEQAASDGTAYAFALTGGSPGGWTQTQELSHTLTYNNLRFGRGKSAMSADGNTIIISAQGLVDGAATFVGGGFVYTRSGGTWTEQQILQPSDGASFAFGLAGDYSSTSISNDGSTVVIGAYLQTTSGQAGNGAAYVWTGTPGSYTENAKILPSTTENGQNFGRATAIRTNNEMFIAAAQRNVTFSDQGAVYVYSV